MSLTNYETINLLAFLCVLIVNCSNQRNEHISIDDFDGQAKQYFLKNVNADSIRWLDTTEVEGIECPALLRASSVDFINVLSFIFNFIRPKEPVFSKGC